MSTVTSIDAKLLENVMRPQIGENGKTVTKPVKNSDEVTIVYRTVEAKEVLDFKIDADARTITVVTVDGQKFSGKLPKGWKPAVDIAPKGEGKKAPAEPKTGAKSTTKKPSN